MLKRGFMLGCVIDDMEQKMADTIAVLANATHVKILQQTNRKYECI